MYGKTYSLYNFLKQKNVDEGFIATEQLIIKPDYNSVVTQKGPLIMPSINIRHFKIGITEENFFIGVLTSMILL